MSDSVLDHLTLGYRLLWGRRRELAGVELLAEPQVSHLGVDARHLQAVLAEQLPANGPQLLLSLRQPALLLDLLTHGRPGGPWIVLPPETLADPVLRSRAQQAQTRGLPLVWPGSLGATTSAQARHTLWRPDEDHGTNTLPPGQILGAPASLAQATAALDQREAWAVAGWPVQSTLQTLAAAARQPDRTTISRVVRAIDTDASWDRLEDLICADPVLSYRFLLQVNTVAGRQRGEIDTVQRGLQIWGLRHVQDWLLDQLAQASGEADLRPVRTGMAVRARLVEHLLDPGDEEDLRREVYLCGLYAQLDHLLGEPLPALLSRLPLSQRILQSLLEGTGPYLPALQIAHAIEAGDARGTRALSESYGYAAEDVNRALLRTLASLAT